MYQIINKPNVCIRLDEKNGVIVLIPPDPSNTYYQQYLAWVAEGNTAEEWNQGE
jgi:hypothetical protein